MASSAAKGNNSERWAKLLAALDERLQLGLLDYLERINSYHFEANNLYIEAGDEEDRSYLARPSTLQQLELLAQDAIQVEKVIIK